MVNPLARVVMNNLVKNKEDSIPYRQEENMGSISNLNNKEEQLLKDLIHGKKQAENYTGKRNVVTLDQAVDMIRKDL